MYRRWQCVGMVKLTVYIPASHLEAVKAALFDAGAGRYKGYDRCCWQVAGTGQFRPLAGSRPFVGTPGEVEQVTEWRVELICGEGDVDAVRAALLAAHPYEVPAYDFVRIEV